MSTIALHSTLNISETVRDRGLEPKDQWPMGNQMVTYSIKLRDLRGQTRDSNTIRAQYLENSWRCYLAAIANFYIVCCKAIWSKR